MIAPTVIAGSAGKIGAVVAQRWQRSGHRLMQIDQSAVVLAQVVAKK